jgi:hypothetical protein
MGFDQSGGSSHEEILIDAPMATERLPVGAVESVKPNKRNNRNRYKKHHRS